jgi:hypothetical protein
LKQLFHIKREGSESGQQVLSIRLGEKHGSFAVTNKGGNQFYELGYCSVTDWDESALSAFFANYPVLRNSFYDCQVVYDFPQAILVPSLSGGDEGLASFAGGSGAHTVTEPVTGWQIKTIYGVPPMIHQWVGQKFPTAKFRHQYSIGVRSIDVTPANGVLQVDFREEEFTVLVARSGKILLAQCFPYSTPDDVLYYLLKTCAAFNLSQQELQLSISGLVDQQSSLYRELYQYFIQVGFRDADWDTGPDYPAHFFTSLNDLAQCVS